MRGIYIKVIKKDWYNKDLMDASYDERKNWYETLSKGALEEVIEQFVKHAKDDTKTFRI
jgi:hypothetical protein